MNEMKQRLLNGWNWVRIMYVVMGIYILVQSIILKQWLWTLFGAYFMSMGILGFGCAAGACYTNYSDKKMNQTDESEIDGTKFEEIKEK